MTSRFLAGVRSLAMLARKSLAPGLLLSTLALVGCSPAQTLQSGAAATASPSTVSAGAPSVTLSVSPATATIDIGGSASTFTVTITDPSALGVTWQVNGQAGGSAAVGTISASGVYASPALLPAPATITITAVSMADPTQSASASVTLRDPSAAPTITLTPTQATVAANGGTQNFSAAVTGGTTSTVTWFVNDIAGGNAAVGTITSAGVYAAPAVAPAAGAVTVKAVASADATIFATATVTVNAPAPAAPLISGTPSTSVQAGHAYLFLPTATSKSGGALSFSVSNKPAWATFDTKTGALSGTPTGTDQGTFANVVISVTDGTSSAALPAFTITVQPVTTGSVTLSWVPPTQRTDGTPLTNLAGFRVYYGTGSGGYSNSVSIPNPGLMTYVVSNLPSGTYHFVATAYDATGAESSYSEVATKTIN